MSILIKSICAILLLSAILVNSSEPYSRNRLRCSLKRDVLREIRSHRADVQKIISYIVNGPDKGKTYEELAKFVDKFGHRLTGTENLEKSIDYMVDLLKSERLENVHTEELQVPHWERGNESATLISPRMKNIAVMGLGGSVGTQSEGITAEAIVVRSFDELKSRGGEVRGKIVVFNQKFEDYFKTGIYRYKGASEVSKLGGIASLIRSITDYSIYSPHTGIQIYDANVTKIPTACITIEDAELLDRMSKRGDKLIVNLKMDAKNLDPAISRNTIADIPGSKKPEQMVIVSGHIDSWDVGQGALDDAGGCFISWRALSVLRKLNLKPTRTLRAVLFTAEEQYLIGSEAYFKKHLNEYGNLSIIMESDLGTFTPHGLRFSGKNKEAQCIVQEVLKLLDSINATKLQLDDEGSDTTFWINAGHPAAELLNENSRYFHFHHTDGDTMSVMDSHTLDLCTAVWTATSYVFANLKEILPK